MEIEEYDAFFNDEEINNNNNVEVIHNNIIVSNKIRIHFLIIHI